MKVNKLLAIAGLSLGATLAFALSADTASAGSIGGPLSLDDEGMLFVNGQLVLSAVPSAGSGTTPPTPATFAVDQMFVHYRIPHGTADCCATTPVWNPKPHTLPII